MARLTRIGIVFAAKLVAILMGMIGLLAGISYSFGGFFMELSADNLNAGTALAFLALLGMPLLFAAAGLVVGAVGAMLYNLLLRRVPGIEVDLQQRAT